MTGQILITDNRTFSPALFEIMKEISPAVDGLELYEFQYCLDNMTPAEGWDSVTLESLEVIERKAQDRDYYAQIKISPKVDGKPVLDETVVHLTQMLFAGLVRGRYPVEWLKLWFYFDLRGFYFLYRTQYLTEEVVQHFGGAPYRQFEMRQKGFERAQAVGYQEFKAANAEVDARFFEIIDRLIELHGTPVLVGIAGPTAAGKTEIVARLRERYQKKGKQVSAFEMDHYFLDRDYREQTGFDSLGREALHFDLMQKDLHELLAGRRITSPRYDFLTGASSHDLTDQLKPGAETINVKPADIIFMEGNFPFLLPEIAELVAIKVVYLTDDDIRLKRKWRRDMDFRKKYELNYFRNRYFREQFMMAECAYIPQLKCCDLAVDTSGARLWLTSETAGRLK
ncbi:MAG TPA: hypothetical protein VN364_11280 [Bellilinea sp.]|nr:hypothetical protein [Bellilinea sp.]